MKLAKYIMKKTQKNGDMLLLRIAVRKIFVYFQEKHSCRIAFLNKFAGYLTPTGNVLLGNL